MLLARVAGEEDGLGGRNDGAAANALEDAEGHERGQVPRQPTQHAGGREHEDGEREVTPEAEATLQPPRHGDDDHVGHHVARGHPGDLIQRGAKARPDVVERHVDDGDVEHRHQRRGHGGDGDACLGAGDGVALHGLRLPRVHRDDGAHARLQRQFLQVPVEAHQHGDALHHLHEVAGGVVRGQQREARAAGARQAVHMRPEVLAAKGVHLHIHRLARAHPAHLVLLEVGHHPHVILGNDGHQGALGADHLPHLHRAAAHHAVDGRAHLGVGDGQLGQMQGGAGLLQPRFGQLQGRLGRLHLHGPGLRGHQLALCGLQASRGTGDAGLGGGQARLGLIQRGLGLVIRGLARVQLRGGQGPLGGQPLHAGQLRVRQPEARLDRGHIGACLLQGRLGGRDAAGGLRHPCLGLPQGGPRVGLGEGQLRLRVGQLRLGAQHVRLGHLELRVQVAAVELHQDVPGLHRLVVLHQHLHHLPSHARGHVADAALHLRVIRGLAAMGEEEADQPSEQCHAQQGGEDDAGAALGLDALGGGGRGRINRGRGEGSGHGRSRCLEGKGTEEGRERIRGS
ncbi:conserved hypothetical protein [Stigmatella aurantiaca DW4/3-1]|uniref:Uncharacterized protein n=1 Tax=Stigmatella aurantiaca (strain DW4/3-1) TaxID=378806 RepID=Q08VS0_STIAD|nr:conserved hypothetical protein [Stigmatella aurantiaca DW4/3-1]